MDVTESATDGGSSGIPDETTQDGSTTGDDPGSTSDDTAPPTTTDDEETGTGETSSGEGNDIDDYVIGLGTPETPGNVVMEGDVSAAEAAGDYMCSTQDLAETKQFDKIVAFAANSGTLFPGALIGGQSISDGTLTPKVLDRAPLTFSASLEGVLDGAVSATLESPTLSAFREAMADILDANVIGSTPANVAFDIQEVYSEEQLSLAIGLDVSWMTGNVSASMDFAEEERNSRFIVNFTQAYYTVDIDPPGRPSHMLDDTVTLEDVQDVIGAEPPAYVGSVTYGRIVYFAVTSNFSSQELRAALDFGFSAGAVDVDGNVSLTHSEVLSESQITAFILGGNGDIAVQAINGVEELRTFLESGGSYSRDSPGAPIAYKLSYLADNSPARFALTTDYEVTDCERVSQNVRVALSNLRVTDDGADAGGDLEVYGWIRGWDEDSTAYPLMEREDDEYVTINNGAFWPQSGEIGSDIIPVTPQPGHKFSISVNLRESDGLLNGDDSFGDHVIEVDFEDGWRENDFVFSVADGDQQLEAHFEFTPVP